MDNKNLLYSLMCFILGFGTLLSPVPYIDTELTAKLDDFIFGITNYKWLWASTDITYAIFMVIPLSLLLLSVFFALKSIKTNTTQSKTQRIVAIIITTITTGMMVSIVVTGLYVNLSI